MLAVIRHRGPDGEGVTSAGQVTLGHRRLSILGLGPTGAQPMVRQHAALTYNGEIYNHVELRRELEGFGHSFRSTSDTEVLLVAYLQWGESFVERLDGMWAFALHDRRAGLLLLSRDRFGEKPLLLGRKKGSLYFASEHRQLRAIGIGRKPNSDTALEYLALGRQTDPTATYFEGIDALAPGTSLRIDLASGVSDTRRYYWPGSSGTFTGVEQGDFQSVFEEEFTRSIRTRLRSDVPVGTLLSGGVDSSLIASLAGAIHRDATGSPLPAFTAVSDDPGNDESSYARLVARRCGLDWHPVRVSAESSKSLWASTTEIYEQPTDPSMPMQMEVLSLAKACGVTVILDGQGADEAWQGYTRYAVAAMNGTPWSQRFRFLRESSAHNSFSTRQWILHYLYFNYPRIGAERNSRRMAKLGLPVSRGWLAERMARTVGARGRTLRQVQIDELGGEQTVSLLRYMDRMTMHLSMEGRVPFLDHRLVELAIHASREIKFQNGWSKHPLRLMLAKRVGPEVAWRTRKIGFEGPRDAFDPADPAVVGEIRSSSLLREWGLDGVDVRRLPARVGWRLFALAIWDQLVVRA